MPSKRYTEEFKAEAARLTRERNCTLKEISKRLGVSAFSLSRWTRQSLMPKHNMGKEDLEQEVMRLWKELRRFLNYLYI